MLFLQSFDVLSSNPAKVEYAFHPIGVNRTSTSWPVVVVGEVNVIDFINSPEIAGLVPTFYTIIIIRRHPGRFINALGKKMMVQSWVQWLWSSVCLIRANRRLNNNNYNLMRAISSPKALSITLWSEKKQTHWVNIFLDLLCIETKPEKTG